MGKRVAVATSVYEPYHHVTPITPTSVAPRGIRKRKCNAHGVASAGHGAVGGMMAVSAKTLRMNASNNSWQGDDDDDDDDEENSSNDATTPRKVSSKQANNSSIMLNSHLNVSIGSGNEHNVSLTESPKPVYTLRPSIVNGTILYDLTQKPWRLGRPIGKGNFGEIFLASDIIGIPVTNENAKFVVKIEPHSNGPLFVEIHCLMNTAKKSCNVTQEEFANTKRVSATATVNLPQNPPSGIPDYIASGSHYFGDARYRFLVLPRFDRDLHSLIKNCRVHQKSVLTLAVQIVNVLEKLHDKGYCHNDVKAQNLMISKCKYYKQQQQQQQQSFLEGNIKSGHNQTNSLKLPKYDEHYDEKQQTTDSGNSSEQEAHEDDDDEEFVVKRKVYFDDGEEDDEDFDDGATSNSNNSNSLDLYQTPLSRGRKYHRGVGTRNAMVVEYSGSNPVRSCRRQKRNSTYDEMVKSHYLRPTKRISYSEFFNEDGSQMKSDEVDHENAIRCNSSDEESGEFVPHSMRRSAALSRKALTTNCESRRLTRLQEKLLSIRKRKVSEQDNKKQNVVEVGATAPASAYQQLVEEEHIFLIDFGLASKYVDNGVHRPFVMDQRRAHDGTLEFTSRDAHMGAHSRRSDLECLGYNLLFWSQGYLPWKDAATHQQQEKVHRAKEYLMTDVRELLRQIYGKQVPKYLGEFLHHVGQLAYHERPDYDGYRRMFEREYQQLGYTLSEMRLDMQEIVRTSVRVKEEIENKNDIFEMNKHNNSTLNAWSVMKNLSVGTPFHERTLSNRVSPKNLRSKSDKKTLKKKKFSWAEILSQDPDQIARERAEKEFNREEESSMVQQPTVRRYEGKPTYAILDILRQLQLNGRLVEEETTHSLRNHESIKSNQKKGHREQCCMEMDVCDGNGDIAVSLMNKSRHNNHEGLDDEVETDATETSENRTERTTTLGRKMQQTRKTRKSNTTNSGKTVLKTLAMTPTAAAAAAAATVGSLGSEALTKPIGARTRGKRANTTTLPPSINKMKLVRTNNRRNNNTRIVRKTSGMAAASAAGEVEHTESLGGGNGERQQQTFATRERRTRRCLIKTDGTLEEDSNSNFTPDVCGLFNVWKKFNNENLYLRNCKK